MPKIDPRLIALLKKRLGVAERTVYAAIQKTAVANRVSRDLGALLRARMASATNAMPPQNRWPLSVVHRQRQRQSIQFHQQEDGKLKHLENLS